MSYSARLSTKSRQSVATRPLHRTDRMLLSQAIIQYPRYCEDRKITLVEKSVTALDEVPKRFTTIETLLLSNNLIRELTHIGQFTALKSLSLANNKLERLSQLLALKDLQHLEMLYLEGNPLTQLPTYRDFLLDLLPSLRFLDSQEVTEQERTQAKLNIKQLSRILDLLIKNEEEGTRLEHLRRLLLVHKELINKGGVGDYSGVVVSHFLAWVPLEWPESMRAMVQDSFESKAKQILKRNRGKDWLWAYTQSLMEQQQIIARLMMMCEQGAKETLEVSITRDAVTQSRKSRPMPGKQVKLGSGSRGASSPNASQPFTPVADSGDEAQVQKPELAPSPPVREQRSVANTESSGGKAVNRAQTLPEEVHSAPQRQLLMENEILRKKLSEYARASRQSDAETQDVVQELQSKVEKLAKQCADSEKEKTRIESKLSIAVARNAALEEKNSLLRAETGAGEVAPVQVPAIREIATLSEAVRSRIVKIETMKAWKRFVVQMHDLRALSGRAADRYNQSVVAAFLDKWNLAFVASTHRRELERRHQVSAARALFKGYKQLKRRELRLSRISARINDRSKSLGFLGFRTLPIVKSQSRAKKAMAQGHYSDALFRRALKAWRLLAEAWVIPSPQLQAMEGSSQTFRDRKLKEYLWTVWRDWRASGGTSQYQMVLTAESQHRRHLHLQLFATLQAGADLARKFASVAAAFREKAGTALAAQCLKALKTAVAVRRVKEHLNSVAKKHYDSYLFETFRHCVRSSICHTKATSIAQVANKVVLCRRVFNGMRRVTNKFKRITEAYQEVRIRCKQRRLRGAIMKWALAAMHPQYQDQIRRLKMMRDIVTAWVRSAAKRKAARYRAAIGLRLWDRNQLQKRIALLTKWRLYTKRRNSEKLAATKLETAVSGRLALRHYFCWKAVYCLSKFARAELKLQEAQKEQRLCAIVRSQASDLESQVQDQTAKMSEKDREIVKLRVSVSELTNSCEHYESQMLKNQSVIEALEREVTALTAALQEAKSEYEEKEERYEQELRIAEERMEAQGREIDAKDGSLQSAFDRVKEAEEEMNARVKELEAENHKLRSELKSRDVGIRYTDMLSQSLRTGLEKATKVLERPTSTERQSDRFSLPQRPDIPRLLNLPKAVPPPNFSARSTGRSADPAELKLEAIQTERAKIEERLMTRTKGKKEGGKFFSVRSTPRSGSEG